MATRPTHQSGAPAPNDRAFEVDRSLDEMEPAIRASFTDEQYHAVRRAMLRCTRHRGRFPIDLRFTVNFWIRRFFVVLLVGPERRSPERTARERRMRQFRIANVMVIVLASVMVLLAALGAIYVLKSSFGIDLMPDTHVGDLLS